MAAQLFKALLQRLSTSSADDPNWNDKWSAAAVRPNAAAMDFTNDPEALARPMDFTNDMEADPTLVPTRDKVEFADQTIEGRTPARKAEINTDVSDLPVVDAEQNYRDAQKEREAAFAALPRNKIDLNPSPSERDPALNGVGPPQFSFYDMDHGYTLGPDDPKKPTLESDGGNLALAAAKERGSAQQTQASRSSKQKVHAPGAGAMAQAKEIAAGAAQATKNEGKDAAPVANSDSRMDELSRKQRGLEGERTTALDQAKHAKDMSTEEMVAMALITLLPTIVGGIAGHAVAGTAGGAAGVAGGLTGASQGFQAINASKEKDKEQALAQAAQAASRGDKVDQELLQRQGQLDQAGQFGQKLKQEADLTALREKGDTTRATAANAAHLKAANISAYAQLKAAEMNNNGAVARAEMKFEAAKEGGAMKDFQGKAASHAIDMLMAKPVLDSVKDPSVLNSFQSWNALQAGLADPKQQMVARAILNYVSAALYQDTGAAISDKEWNTAFTRYIGRWTSSPQDLVYAQDIRDAKIKGTLGIAGPVGTRIAEQTVADIQASHAPHGGDGTPGAPVNNKAKYGF